SSDARANIRSTYENACRKADNRGQSQQVAPDHEAGGVDRRPPRATGTPGRRLGTRGVVLGDRRVQLRSPAHDHADPGNAPRHDRAGRGLWTAGKAPGPLWTA